MSSTNLINIEVPLSLIRPGRIQFRRKTGFDRDSMNGFAKSVKQHGIINAPIVYQEGEFYLLHAGERRWRSKCLNVLVEKKFCSWEVGLEIICGMNARDDLVKLGYLFQDVLIEVRLSPAESLDVALSIVENGQRENLKLSEEGAGYQDLLERGYTVEEVIDMANKPPATVRAAILLTQLEPEIQDWIDQGQLPRGLDSIKTLVGVENGEARLGVARRVAVFEKGEVDKGRLIKNLCTALKKSPAPAAKDDRQKGDYSPGEAVTARRPKNGTIPISKVAMIPVYTPPARQFDHLPPDSTEIILSLAEECCSKCLATGFRADCLKCEGFVSFAQLLIQELNYRQVIFKGDEQKGLGMEGATNGEDNGQALALSPNGRPTNMGLGLSLPDRDENDEDEDW